MSETENKNVDNKPSPEHKVEPVKVDPPKVPLKTGTDAPQIGLGTTLTVGGTVVVKVMSIKLPNYTSKDVETTGMNDTIDQYIPGVPNAGEGEFDILYMKSQSTALYALKNVPATSFSVVLPDGGTRSWSGFINSFGEEVPLKEKITTKIKCRATSIVTIG